MRVIYAYPYRHSQRCRASHSSGSRHSIPIHSVWDNFKFNKLICSFAKLEYTYGATFVSCRPMNTLIVALAIVRIDRNVYEDFYRGEYFRKLRYRPTVNFLR